MGNKFRRWEDIVGVGPENRLQTEGNAALDLWRKTASILSVFVDPSVVGFNMGVLIT